MRLKLKYIIFFGHFLWLIIVGFWTVQQAINKADCPPKSNNKYSMDEGTGENKNGLISCECEKKGKVDESHYIAIGLCHQRLESREKLPGYLNSIDLTGEAVEVGVKEGHHSLSILSKWKGKKLHMVDPWVNQDKKTYVDISNADDQTQEYRFQELKRKLELNYRGRYKLHRGYSVPVSNTFNDSSLDFVYIDARHDYEGVLEDCEAWWPKLRVGGLMAGHDFVPDGDIREGRFGVQKAVKEFSNKVGVEIQTIASKNLDTGRKEPQHLDGGWTTWYFHKPPRISRTEKSN